MFGREPNFHIDLAFDLNLPQKQYVNTITVQICPGT